MAEEVKSNIDKIKALREDYKKVFSSEEGKRVLKDLEDSCFYNSTTMSDKSLIMAAQEGQRCVVLHIKTILSRDVEALEKLYSES